MAVSIKDIVAMVRAAAIESADYQQRFAAEDVEARKIVDVMETFLRKKARIVYGGAAINAHLPPAKQFYDPTLYLPDYDFLTPDPLQDCAELIVAFHQEGFDDVEAKFGIHEGTYKVFVNFRAAADITYMPPDIYSRVNRDAFTQNGIQYANADFLRMNIFVELSRPRGNTERWAKVYERLLLLNEAHPIKTGRCSKTKSGHGVDRTHSRILNVGIDADAIFLGEPEEEPILLMSDKAEEFVSKLGWLTPVKHAAIGELVPARTEFRNKQGDLLAVVFNTVACHSYTLHPDKKDYRLGSLELLIEMYYAFYFTGLTEYKQGRLLCVIRDLIDREYAHMVGAVKKRAPPSDVLPIADCVGYQPTLPELKKAHRQRVREKQRELMDALKITESKGK